MVSRRFDFFNRFFLSHQPVVGLTANLGVCNVRELSWVPFFPVRRLRRRRYEKSRGRLLVDGAAVAAKDSTKIYPFI